MTPTDLKDMHDAEMRGSDASKLKPCPFCGGNAAIMGGPTAQERWAVWCENGHNMRGGASKEAAIAAWNTRVSPSPEAFQQMREALNRIQNWRDECHDYDRDMGHEPREFDDDDLVMVEAYARAALKAPELKPCPWCGGTNITKADDGESEWLICANCEATGPYSPDAYAADLSIEQAWNTRVSPSPEAFQQMREALNRIQNWRDECHDYDRDMGHEPREFDDDDLVMVEAYARAALKAAEESK